MTCDFNNRWLDTTREEKAGVVEAEMGFDDTTIYYRISDWLAAVMVTVRSVCFLHVTPDIISLDRTKINKLFNY